LSSSLFVWEELIEYNAFVNEKAGNSALDSTFGAVCITAFLEIRIK
jgi:hypothetical protein